jgi:1,4-alpha-glucan branching enzyme
MVEAASDGNGSVVTVFRLPHEVLADEVCVVGEFNDWSTTANPMERDGNEFVARIELAPGRSYRFRYLLDGQRWENDWSADAYVPNEFGGEDSVIDLTTSVTGEAGVGSADGQREAKRARKPATAEETP